MEEDDWRDKETVRGTAMVDVLLSLFLLGFYIIGLFVNTIIIEVPNGLFTKFNLFLISMAVWAAVFSVTVLQLISAYKLFLVTYQDALGPSVSIQRSQRWLRTAAAVFVLIALKVIYFLARKQSCSNFIWVLCLVETGFRIFGVYFVREFIDDLKHQMAGMKRSVSFIKCVDSHKPRVAIQV